MPDDTGIEIRNIEANGIRFALLEAGDGPLLLLLHGYPDNAWTWEWQIPSLARAGFRVVAPFLRGYPPSEVPARGYFDMATLVTDVRALIDGLNAGQAAFVVGQDWGAAITYGLLAACPDSVRRAAALAIPHPAQIRRTLKRSPRHAIRSFHWFLYQLPWLPELMIRYRDGAFIRTLWRLWSPGFDDEEHVAEIRQMMASPGVVEATLAYYRAIFRSDRQDPGLADVRERLSAPIRVPTLVLCGSQDMRAEMLAEQAEFFTSEYDWQIVDGAGHFLHREKPEAVNRFLIDWLQRG